MAKTKTPPAPPSAEARAHALDVIGTTAEPVTSAQLAKLLEASHKIREKELAPILEEFVAANRLFRLPGKTAKGKPRYWDRDAGQIAREAALEAMEQAEAPLTAKELAKRAAAPIKLSESELTAFLEEQVAAGTLHAIPKATAKGQPRFWNQDVVEYGRLAIRDVLRAKGPQSETNLKKAAKGVTESQFRESLGKAIEAGQAWRHPPGGKSKKELIGARPPSPEPYLEKISKQLGDVAGRLTLAGVSREELRRAVVQMAESAGISFAAGGKSAPSSTPAAPVPTYDLLALMKRIEPGAERGALVTSRDLRRVAELGKQEFDRAVMELARQGRLSLHRHDFVSSLSESEREELVSDGNGTYYVGMAIRQNTR